MTRTFAFLLGLALIAPSFAFASCEDGDSLAESGALQKVAQTVPNAKTRCQATSTDQLEGKDVFVVQVRCDKRYLGTFRVTLREIEDAYCVLKSVRRLR